jgi:hypothetical protein
LSIGSYYHFASLTTGNLDLNLRVIIDTESSLSSLSISLQGEFTSMQGPCKTYNCYGLAISLARLSQWAEGGYFSCSKVIKGTMEVGFLICGENELEPGRFP